MKAIIRARVFHRQLLDMTADGAQFEPAPPRRTPGRKGHPRAVFSQYLRIGRVGLGAAQRLRKAVNQLRIQHRDFDAIGPVQRQRKVQRIDAGRLQRYTRPR